MSPPAPEHGCAIAEHPLAARLDHIRELNDHLGAELGRPPGGWISLSRLVADRALLDDALKRTALSYEATRRIAANFVAGAVTWATTAAPLALMMLERRAIGPEPAATFIRIDERGQVNGVFYDDPSFCVLTADPAADHERACAVDDQPALHEWTRAHLVDSLQPLVCALSDLSHLGRRGLWGQITSSWGSIIVWAARLAGDASQGLQEAEAFLSGPGIALSNPPAFYRVHHRSEELVAMRRGVCCLAYKLSDYPYCGSCPLISDDERSRRLRDEPDGERA